LRDKFKFIYCCVGDVGVGGLENIIDGGEEAPCLPAILKAKDTRGSSQAIEVTTQQDHLF
jgi:hypothetical protein